MAAKKSKKEETAPAASTNTVSVYDAALDEIKNMDSDAARRKVETGPLREGRGQDVIRLHTTLKAVDAAHSSLASQMAGFQGDANAHFEKTWDTMASKFDKTWDAVDKDFNKTWDTVDKQFNKTWDAVDKSFNQTWEAQTEGFEKTWKSLETKFDKTWETLGTNFDATNERTKREVHDLREELTKLLDKRFTHIDQTFASLRADIEVLKALQMELIKERIGRPEIVKR